MTSNPQVQAYYDDSYLLDVEAVVTATGSSEEGSWIAVSPNIFHPKGGGQPSDAGTVDGVPASPARDDEGLVILSGPFAETEPGAVVRCEVDGQTRRLHAALHTAGHVLGHVGEARGWTHSGHSHFPGQARLDFSPKGHEEELATPELRETIRLELQAAMDATLAAGGAVTCAIDEAGHRTVTIEGVNSEPCGGTHVRNLADLGQVEILEVKVKRGALKVRYDASHA